MKKTEHEIREIGIIILLFIALFVMMYYTIDKDKRIKSSSIEDIHQQQEMIDYHRSEGRNIIVFE